MFSRGVVCAFINGKLSITMVQISISLNMLTVIKDNIWLHINS
jgi:hypothetical protein